MKLGNWYWMLGEEEKREGPDAPSARGSGSRHGLKGPSSGRKDAKIFEGKLFFVISNTKRTPV